MPIIFFVIPFILYSQVIYFRFPVRQIRQLFKVFFRHLWDVTWEIKICYNTVPLSLSLLPSYTDVPLGPNLKA